MTDLAPSLSALKTTPFLIEYCRTKLQKLESDILSEGVENADLQIFDLLDQSLADLASFFQSISDGRTLEDAVNALKLENSRNILLSKGQISKSNDIDLFQ